MLDFLIGNDFLSSIVAFVLVLIIAIIIHELGHLLAAKAVGITILEFGVGFPPRVARLFSWGETEFTLNWIPLGGFVRPLGEDMIRPTSESETQAERDRLRERMADNQVQADRSMASVQPALSEREELAARGVTNIKAVNEANPWARLLFIIAGPLANVLGAFVLFICIGLIGVAQPVGGRVFVETVNPNSALAEAGLQGGDFIETLNGALFTNSRDFFRQLVALDGSTAVITVQRPVGTSDVETLTLEILVVAEEATALAAADGRILVSSVQAGSPAAAAGLLPGDAIIGLGDVDLRPTDNPFAALQRVNRENEGREMPLRILRDSEELTLRITPRVNPAPGEGHLGAGVQTMFISPSAGFAYGEGPAQVDYQPLPFGEAVGYGYDQIRNITLAIAGLPGRLLRGQAQPEEGRVISIVGVTQLGSEFLQQSIQQNQPIIFLNFMALINIGLAITQLLPILPLDGGRILFILIEIVRGRPMSPEREGTFMLIGIAFLLSLGVYFILYDLLNPVTNLLP